MNDELEAPKELMNELSTSRGFSNKENRVESGTSSCTTICKNALSMSADTPEVCIEVES